MSKFIESVDGMTEVPIPKRPRRSVKLTFGVLDNDFIATSDDKTFWRFGSSCNYFDKNGQQYVSFVTDDRYAR